MKFENTKVFNLEGALRGMRNPLDSWNKSDSSFGTFSYEPMDDGYDIAEAYYGDSNWRNSDDAEAIKEAEDEIEDIQNWLIDQGIWWSNDIYNECGTWNYIGPQDMNLAQRLIKAGPEHRKFMRQIMVSVDITAPLYWWKEFSTYKVGTVANSCSTMHKLASYPITLENFEIEDYDDNLLVDKVNQSEVKDPEFIDHWHIDIFTEKLIEQLEDLRQMYIKTKDKKYWKELVRWLPEGWLQKRTVTLNYEVLRSMRIQRNNHKLTEWKSFCDWVDELPYAEDLILYGTGLERE